MPPSRASLPGPPFKRVVAGEVGDDVVAVTAERHVVAAVALDDVVAGVAPEGVVVVAAGDTVGAGRTVVDALPVDARRIDAVELAVADLAVRGSGEQQVLVAIGGARVVVDRADTGDGADTGRALAGEVAELELAVGRGKGVGLHARRRRVAHDQLGERVALELGPQVHAGRAVEVVQPVVVLQLGQLQLEDVVERRAQQTTEQVGHLGQAADPQVDIVETGDAHACGGVLPCAGAVHEVGGVGRLHVTRTRRG